MTANRSNKPDRDANIFQVLGKPRSSFFTMIATSHLVGRSTRKRGCKLVELEHVRFDPRDIHELVRSRRIEARR